MIDGRIVGEVFQIRSLQFGNIVAHVLPQLFVLLIIGESRIGDFRGIFFAENVEQHDGIAHDGVDNVHDIHIPYHLHATCGSASRQYPGIAEFRIECPQLIHVLQHGHQFLLRLEHVGSHALVILPGHHLEELVEIF